MTSYTYLKIGGTAYNYYSNGNVLSTIGTYNAASSCMFRFTNKCGELSSSFTMGDDVEVWIDDEPITDTSNATKIFTGILEDIDLKGMRSNSAIIIGGRDYTALLQDTTIPPEVYNNQSINTIIVDIMTKYVTGVTYNNVAISKVISRISFNHISVFDALKRLCEFFDGYFYVDTSKVLQVGSKGQLSSGKTFNETNTVRTSWNSTRKDIVNQVYVYGDKYLTGFKETFTADGGSVFTLAYKPHNTEILASGLIQKGGVNEMTSEPASGVNFLVSFYDKTISFTSGTAIGDSTPASGVTVQANYDRSSPIAKFGNDKDSIKAYKLKENIVIDKSIKDPVEASNRVQQELLKADPKREGSLYVRGINYLVAGQTCIVDISFDGVENTQYDMLEINYDLNKNSLLRDEIISIKLNKRTKNINDSIKALFTKTQFLEAGDIDDVEVITRIEFATGSLSLKSNWKYYLRDVGSGIVFDSTDKFRWDSSGGSVYWDGFSGDKWVEQASGGTF